MDNTFDLNENPQMPDLSGVKENFSGAPKVHQMNFIGNVIIRNKTKFTKEYFQQMFKESFKGISNDSKL